MLPYVTQMGVRGHIFRKKYYEGLRFNVISVTRGGWGSNFQEKDVIPERERDMKREVEKENESEKKKEREREGEGDGE